MKKRVLLSENQVKYVEDIIIKRNTANLEMSRKEVIQVISEIVLLSLPDLKPPYKAF